MNRTALARPLRRARSPLGGLTRALGIPAATLLCAASLATADPDIAGKLEGAADLRARPSGAVLGRGVFDRLLAPHDQLRETAHRALGLDYFAYYSTLFQQGSEGDAEDARSVVTQLHAVALWDLVEHPALGKGSLGVYFVDARKFLGKSATALSEHCDTSLGVNDADIDEPFTALKDLWWEQRLFGQRLSLLAGQIELQGLMNANTYADDDTFSFLAQPVATNPATVIVPAGLGAFAQIAPSDHGYLSLAFVDAAANGKFPDFETFANGEYLYAGELGITPDIPGVGVGTYRATGFWRDATESAPSAAGWALSFEQDLGERAGLFLRYAGVDEDDCDLQQVLGAGAVLRRPFGRDRDWIGLAFMWGDVTAGSPRNEYALEAYWRLQLTERLEFTPDLQVHLHPDRGDSVSVLGGLRLRIAL
ncbi:MAG TPA: carbohydrate porin [Myxococcota bacterium]